MLTAAQKTDTRRFCGYPILSPDPAFADPAVVKVPGQFRTLSFWLDNLSAEQEAVLVNFYLTQIPILEAAIPAMSDSIDTNAAGTWKANPQEMGQRISLFNRVRRDLCNFIGVDPGPGLGSGGINIVRA